MGASLAQQWVVGVVVWWDDHQAQVGQDLEQFWDQLKQAGIWQGVIQNGQRKFHRLSTFNCLGGVIHQQHFIHPGFFKRLLDQLAKTGRCAGNQD